MVAREVVGLKMSQLLLYYKDNQRNSLLFEGSFLADYYSFRIILEWWSSCLLFVSNIIDLCIGDNDKKMIQ